MNNLICKHLTCILALLLAHIATVGFAQDVVVFDETGLLMETSDDPDLLRIELPDPGQVSGDATEVPVEFFTAEDPGVIWLAAPDSGTASAEAEAGLRVEAEVKPEPLVITAPTPRIEVTPPKPKVVQEPPQMVRDLNDGKVLRLYAIRFDLDKATLRPEAMQTIDQIAEALTSDPTLDLIVEGHTDAQADDSYNVGLSECRAQSVVDILVRNHGIAATRLTPIGMGETHPVKPNDTAEGRQLNRRVELRRQINGQDAQPICQDRPTKWFD